MKMYERVNMGKCVGSIVIATHGVLVLLTCWCVCWLALVSCPGSMCGLMCKGTVTTLVEMS